MVYFMENKNPVLVSIIIPNYNAEEYLRKCLDSVVNQTLTDIEIICVNDGSTDRSLDIFEEYAKNDNRIIIIDKENEGQSVSRNTGFKLARGEYIAFVDSDDYIDLDAYENLYKFAKKYNQDMVIFDVLRFNSENEWRGKLHRKAISKYVIDYTNITEHPELVYDTGPWNKLIKKSFWDKHSFQFKKNRLYEDLLLSMELHCSTDSIGIYPHVKYHWRLRGGENASTTQRTYEIKNLEDRLFIVNKITELFESNPKHNELLKYHYDKCLNHDFLIFINRVILKNNEYNNILLGGIKSFLNNISPETYPYVKIINKVKYDLILEGDIETLIKYITYQELSKKKKAKNTKILFLYFLYIKGGILKKISKIYKQNNQNLSKKFLKVFSNPFFKLKNRIVSLKRILIGLNRNQRIFKYMENLKIDSNLIFFDSKNGNDIAGNIFYILKELSKSKYENYKIIISIKKELLDEKRNLLNRYNIKNVKFVEYVSINYYKYLYQAKYLFSDATLPTSFIKKEGQIYINTWHGTPLKNLGRTNLNRAYGLGNVQRNFIMADYLIYPNEFMKEKMIDSFMLENLSNAKIINGGYPRNSIFFNKKAANNLKSKMGLNDKRIIAYMPTWRGIFSNLDIDGQNDIIKQFLKELDILLNDNQVFYVKFHAVVEDMIDYSKYKHIHPFPKEYETYEFLNIVDCLVTDYSSVFFDFVCSNKKIVLFPYDEEEYIDKGGLYFSLDELPFPKVYNVENLYDEIISSKNYDDNDFLEKYNTYDEKDAPKNLCNFIFFNENSDKLFVEPLNVNLLGFSNKSEYFDKTECLNKSNEINTYPSKNVLIHSGNIFKNSTTDTLMELIENTVMDTLKNSNISEKKLESEGIDKYTYYFVFKGKSLIKYSPQLSELSSKIKFIPLVGNLNFKFTEFLCYSLNTKLGVSNKLINKYLDKMYKRNVDKYFPNNDFYAILNFSSQDIQTMSLFNYMNSQKTIFLSEKLINTIKNSKTYLNFLNNSLKCYDRIFTDKKEAKKFLSKSKSKSRPNIINKKNGLNSLFNGD